MSKPPPRRNALASQPTKPVKKKQRNFFIFHRNWLEHPRFCASGWLELLAVMMSSASRKEPLKVFKFGMYVLLDPGCLISSRSRLAESTGMSTDKIKDLLDCMERDGDVQTLREIKVVHRNENALSRKELWGEITIEKIPMTHPDGTVYKLTYYGIEPPSRRARLLGLKTENGNVK